MERIKLPANWSSTANALEEIAHAAKDTLLVVDDFKPTGPSATVARFHQDADRFFRAVGNHSGRQRLRSDTTMRTARPPRCLPLSTGEDVPRGQSLQARVLIAEVAENDISAQRLTECQRDAAAGLYAQAMSGFVRWIAQRYEEVCRQLPADTQQIRDATYKDEQHRRTPAIVAELAVGVRWFLQFATAAGAISAQEWDQLWEQIWKGIAEAADEQAGHHTAAEPTDHFMRLLRAAVASGQAHVANKEGDAPEAPESWGWRLEDHARTRPEGPAGYRVSYQPQGRRVGWIDGENLYLEPEASFACAQRLASEQGESLCIAPRTLHKRLKEKQLLLSHEKGHGTNTIRRILEGARRSVLHLSAGQFLGRSGQFTGQLPGGISGEPPVNQSSGNGATNELGSLGSSITTRDTYVRGRELDLADM
jgi:hypothetical protein